MHRKEKRHLTYASIDIDIALFVRRSLRDRLMVNDKDIHITAMFRDFIPTYDGVANLLEIADSHISLRFSDRAKHTAYNIQISAVLHNYLFFDYDYIDSSSDESLWNVRFC